MGGRITILILKSRLKVPSAPTKSIVHICVSFNVDFRGINIFTISVIDLSSSKSTLFATVFLA